VSCGSIAQSIERVGRGHSIHAAADLALDLEPQPKARPGVRRIEPRGILDAHNGQDWELYVPAVLRATWDTPIDRI
jgi:hypothetical protein